MLNTEDALLNSITLSFSFVLEAQMKRKKHRPPTKEWMGRKNGLEYLYFRYTAARGEDRYLKGLCLQKQTVCVLPVRMLAAMERRGVPGKQPASTRSYGQGAATARQAHLCLRFLCFQNRRSLCNPPPRQHILHRLSHTNRSPRPSRIQDWA